MRAAMNLIQIKKYFQSVPMATTIDVAEHFKTQPVEIKCYVEHWEHKGLLKKCITKNKCGSCSLCDFDLLQHYKWSTKVA